MRYSEFSIFDCLVCRVDNLVCLPQVLLFIFLSAQIFLVAVNGSDDVYELVKSGVCADSNVLDNGAECETAARALGFKYRSSVDLTYQQQRPMGCYRAEKDDDAFLNEAQSNVPCSAKRPCICKAGSPNRGNCVFCNHLLGELTHITPRIGSRTDKTPKSDIHM